MAVVFSFSCFLRMFPNHTNSHIAFCRYFLGSASNPRLRPGSARGAGDAAGRPRSQEAVEGNVLRAEPQGDLCANIDLVNGMTPL